MAAVVRRIEERDLEAAIELFIEDAEEAKGYPDPYHNAGAALDHDDLRAHFREEFAGYMARPDAIVCVVDSGGTIAGFAIGEVTSCPRPGFFRAVEQVGAIEEVYVSPKYRRNGFARMMEAYLVEDFRRRGLKFAQLSFFSANRPAGQTWTALGYEPEMIRARKRI